MNLRELQEPLKQRYRAEPDAAVIRLTARASEQQGPMACSVDIGRAVYEAQAHAGVGGAGTAACSGDLLLGALAACAQITCQMVAAASGVPLSSVEVTVEGDLDLRGTLGVDREVPVGFAALHLRFDLDAPEATQGQLERLQRQTERYCVVMQTLLQPPTIAVDWT
jgi:uncharacterized OsmC-like protein